MSRRFSIIGMLITTIISNSNLQAKWQKIPYTGKKKIIQLAVGAPDQMWAFVLEGRKKKSLHLAKWNAINKTWDKKLPLSLEETVYLSLSVAPDGSVFFLDLQPTKKVLQRFKNGTLKTIHDFTKSKDRILSVAALGKNSFVILKEGRRFTGKTNRYGVEISYLGSYVEKWDGSSRKQIGQFIKDTGPSKKFGERGKHIYLNRIAAGTDGALYIGGSIKVSEYGKTLIYNSLLTWDDSSWRQIDLPVTNRRIDFAVVKKNDVWLLLRDERMQIQNLLHWDGTRLEKKKMAPIKFGGIAAGPSGVIMYTENSMYKWTEK